MLLAMLEDLGHPQAATPIQTTNNICASGITNDTDSIFVSQHFFHMLRMLFACIFITKIVHTQEEKGDRTHSVLK
jgi:hypothetical protein